MKTRIYLVVSLILVNDNRCLFSDAKPTEGSRGRCGKGQFHDSNADKCMPCIVTCKKSEELCRRHDCYASPKVQVKSRKKNVTEKESVQLECVTSGGIPDDIRRYMWLWKKSDSSPDQVIQDTNTKISMRNGKVLDFSRIRYDQSGTYTCKAWNLAGVGQGSIVLNVQSLLKMSIICVKRADNIVTIRWKQLIGHYTAIKVKYCRTGTKYCVIYIVPNPEDTSATWLVDPDKTYYYYMVIEDGGDVVYTSHRLVVNDSDAKTDMAAPEMSVIGVSRADDKVTIRWKQVIGKYTVLKVKYCLTGTEDCVIYIVPNPGDTSATWFVDPDKTYYYYMVMEDGGDVVYTSNPLVVDDSDAKTDMAAPKLDLIGVRRTDHKVTIRWQKVMGHYTAIKVKYCQTGTENCVIYIVPNPDDTSATWFVDPDKTYEYYVMIEDGGDVVYTSNPLVVEDSDAKTDMAAPKMSVIGVSRKDNKVTIRWKQVTRHFTAIKVKYCQTGSGYCEYYIAPDSEATSATWFVDPDKTYYYYMVIEDGGDVVYTSNPLVVDYSNTKTDMVAVTVGGSVTGAVILTATGVILAVALWKRSRSRKKLKIQLANYNNDDDATRTALAAIKISPKHTYANIGTASLNHISSHSARTAKKYTTTQRAKIRYFPANKVRFGEEPSAYSGDNVDIDQLYDYTDTMCQRDASGSRPHVPASQTSKATWKQDFPAQIHVLSHQGNQSDPSSTASSYQDMHAGVIESIERQREHEPEGTYNDVRIMVTQGDVHQCTAGSGSDRSWKNLVPSLGANQYDPMNASSNEDVSGQNVSEDSSYDDVRIITQGEPAQSGSESSLNQATWQDKDIYELRSYVFSEKQRGQRGHEPEGACAYNDVRSVTRGQPSLAVRSLSQTRLANKLTLGCYDGSVACVQQSQYEQLKPVEDKHAYLNFIGLSPEQLTPQL